MAQFALIHQVATTCICGRLVIIASAKWCDEGCMSQVQEVKNATDIIEMVGERLALSRAGSYFKAVCPFHSEKTPSFFVSDSLQRFKCYGCGEGGDVISFLEKYEGMSFVEALEYLADRAGIKLERAHFSQEDEERQQVLAALDLAKEYYHYLLTSHSVAEVARQYLKDRQVTSESIKVFQLGYAVNSWDGLIKYLHHKKKYALSILEKAGLIIKKGNRYYDRFRGRLIFPLLNHRGQVVGFSGRVLDAQKQAKYINSPETIVYHKSQMLYGLSELYQEIRKQKEVVVVEGELDVISSTQAHVNQVVAIKGSALTPDHVKLLSRVVERILLALDTDQAGIEATKRAIGIAATAGLELRVVNLAGGKDPDELAKSDPDAWRRAVKGSTSVYEFFLQTALGKYQADTPEGKRQIINELADIFKGIPHAVEKDYYLDKLAQALSVSKNLVIKDIEQFGHKPKPQPRPVPQSATASLPVKLNRRARLERYLWFLVFQGDENLVAAQLYHLEGIEFQTVGLNQIRDYIFKSGEFSFADLSLSLSEDLQRILFDILYDQKALELIRELKLKAELTTALEALKQEISKDQVKQLTAELRLLEKATAGEPSAQQEDKQAELLAKIAKLKRQIKKDQS